MIYTFDKKQNILRALDENNFLTAELTFKINEAATFSFTVTPEYELTDKEKYVALPHPLDQTKFIMLRLISRTDNKDDIEYTAYEYAYQELSTSGYIKDTRPQNANALTLMTKALDGSGWSVGRTTVAGTATTNFYYTDYLSAVSKVVDLLGGEIVFYVEITGNKITGRYMDYLFRQGVDTSKVFADGSNLLSVARKKQSDSIYTAILPRGKGEQVSDGGGNEPDGYGRRIDIKDVVWSTANGKPLNKPAGSFILEDPQATAEYGQANGNARLLIKNFDEVDDPNVLIQQAYNMLMTMNHPLIEYSATVSDVGTLSLGDTVLIMHGQRNLSYKTRVFQVKYDLLHSENTELSLGDNLSSNNITSQINAIRSSIQTNSNQQSWTVSQFGRPSTTFGATQPTEPKIGDVWFKSLPDGNVEIWHYNGTIWVKVITPTTGEEIAQAVDDAVAQANSNTATAIEQNNASQQEVMDDIAKSQADLAIKDGDFNNKAQAMADKALSDAKADTDGKISQQQVTIDGITDTVYKQGTNINSVTQRVTTAEGTLTTATNNISGLQTKQTTTANQVTQEISDRKTGDNNTLQSSKEFTQSSITSAVNGVNSTISQTSNGIIAQISGNNMISNSEFSTDTDWSSKTGNIYLSLGVKAGLDGKYNGQVRVTSTTANTYQGFYHKLIPIFGGGVYSFSAKIHYEMDTNSTDGGRAIFDIWFVDKDANRISSASVDVKNSNPYWNVVKSENVTAPATAVAVQLNFLVNSTAVGQKAWFGQIMMNTGSKVLPYVPNDSTNTTLSLLKDNWSIGIADNIGAITSGIVANSNSMSLISKNITLDGDTTVTGTFWAKQVNAIKVDASYIKVGTLNGSLVNITNINADNIVSGSISGANLNINLNTGSVVFQKGRINSSDYTTDINIDQGYISIANSDTRALLTQGKLQLIDPTLFSPQTNPYLEISNHSSIFNGWSALIKARDSLTVSINGYDQRGFNLPPDEEKFVGLSIGKYSNNLMATKIGGAEQGVIISGGKQFDIGGYGDTPYIYVGSDSSGRSPNGDRVSIHASYFHSKSTYFRTTSGSANVVVSSDGALVRSSSARKYKLDIKNNIPIADSLKLIDVPLSTWVDKHEHEENGSTERYFGMIAEDLRDAGLEYLVQYGEDNEVEGINYDRVALLLIPLVKKLKERIEKLESIGK